MRFDSLSEAINYYVVGSNPLTNLSPYSSLSDETSLIPNNTNSLKPQGPNVLVYGTSIWGIGQIIDISKPIIWTERHRFR